MCTCLQNHRVWRWVCPQKNGEYTQWVISGVQKGTANYINQCQAFVYQMEYLWEIWNLYSQWWRLTLLQLTFILIKHFVEKSESRWSQCQYKYSGQKLRGDSKNLLTFQSRSKNSLQMESQSKGRVFSSEPEFYRSLRVESMSPCAFSTHFIPSSVLTNRTQEEMFWGDSNARWKF